jgi:hypothetical protein
MKRKTIKSKFAGALTELRGHLGKCRTCRAAMKGDGYGELCREANALVFAVALSSMRLSTLHRKAYSDPGGFIYACPDRSIHGQDWASTAEPHPLVATQDWLF